MTALIVARAPSTSPVITTSSLPNATVGSPYSFTLSATGGSGSYAFSLLSASENWGDWLSGLQPIPSGGYTLAAGAVLGTPEQPATDNCVFQVEDTNTNLTSTAALSLTTVAS